MPQFTLEVAAAKVGKYATSESGDSLEMIERPHGGLSLVLVDGQRSGKAAKSISNIVVRKAISLLGDGVRDGAVARAAHDYLRTMRGGKVSATLNIVSVDLQTETIVLSRNSHCPTFVFDGKQLMRLDESSEPVGIRTWTKPVMTELPIKPYTYVVVFTDGVLHAGQRCSRSVDVPVLVQRLIAQEKAAAQVVADAVLDEAVACDQGRPGDDISVLVVAVLPDESDSDGARRMSVVLPIRVRGPIDG
ncbi:MAG: SpoIIE family protein phosphatase [Anaerolineae bacterium]|nr:SpoIIE family protein phosphatase [Anaerolineae bacterium]